jgi:glycosyltransferase involved in cell wall biosynthesis
MEKRKKKYIVYVVLDIYPCATGGMEIFYNKLLPAIAEKKNVALITACEKIKTNHYLIYRIPRKILSIPCTGRFAGLFFTALTLIKLRNNIHIVHLPYTSNSGRWGFIFPLLKKYFGIAYLLHIHGGGMRPWEKLNADRFLFRHAFKILAVSNIIKNEYESRSRRKIDVVYPLVPFQAAQADRNDIRNQLGFHVNDRILLFVGSLKELKAPDVLLESFHQMGKKYIEDHQLKLIYVGDGPLKKNLEFKANCLGFKQHVIFTGKIPYNRVPQYYKMSDIYIIPSKFEGTPKSLLEAMFNKLPVIGSNVHGISNIIDHYNNGLLFRPNDSLDLKNNLLWLIHNQEKAAGFAESAFRHFEHNFSFNSTLKQLIASYQS